MIDPGNVSLSVGGRGQWSSGSQPFFDAIEIVPSSALKFLNQFKRIDLKNQFRKQKTHQNDARAEVFC